MPAVTILIPTWNGIDLLRQFLPSVVTAATQYQQDSKSDVEILIVDDGGGDSTLEWLSAQSWPGVKLTLIRNEHNLGFSGACNRGFAEARHPLVLLLNNDVEVDRLAIAPLVPHFENPEVFAVHCQTRPADNRTQPGNGQLVSFSRGFLRVHRGYFADESSPGPLISSFASGGATMFDRKKFNAVRGFELLLSPFYWEDVEISYRMWKRGDTVLYEPRSIVYHRHSSTIGRLPKPHVKRIQQRNRLIYHWIHVHDRALFASHIAWVAILAVVAPFSNPRFLLSLWDALRRIPAIRLRRQEERNAAKRTDREIFEIFSRFEKNQ